MLQYVIKEKNTKVLLHPVAGQTQTGDIDAATRFRCYQHILKRFPKNSIKLSACPMAMRMAGPRETIWHAIIRKNYGCTHFIVGRDHASPSPYKEPFYSRYEAQDLVKKHEKEIGITTFLLPEFVYCTQTNGYLPSDKISKGVKTASISGTKIRQYLREGIDIPEWFTFSEVNAELKLNYPQKNRRGFVLFIDGPHIKNNFHISCGVQENLLKDERKHVTFIENSILENYFTVNNKVLTSTLGMHIHEITNAGGIVIVVNLQETSQHIAEFCKGNNRIDSIFAHIIDSKSPVITEHNNQLECGNNQVINASNHSFDHYIPCKDQFVSETIQEIMNYLKDKGYLLNLVEKEDHEY